MFFRYQKSDGSCEVRTPEQLVAEAADLKAKYGFNVYKLKGGVFPPQYELECYRQLAKKFPNDRLRYDPNGVLSVEEGTRFGQGIENLNTDYLEDPSYGLSAMERVRGMIRIPLATNTVVVNFEQLGQNVLRMGASGRPPVDVVLLDTTFWDGIRPCIKAAAVCETFNLGIAVHSSGELGIQLATMLHLGAVLPQLSFAADAHYHHLLDDVIEGGLLTYEEGRIKDPVTPGLGVRLDREKLAQYAELYREVVILTIRIRGAKGGFHWFPMNDGLIRPSLDARKPSAEPKFLMAAARPIVLESGPIIFPALLPADLRQDWAFPHAA